ncbi:sodium:proton exchanger [Verminephrobacter aporrectodeae subsp. tuberculatae]|uniref:Sodium:proton exchanger n=1 Tax=Verminephrobacter aporrectodeae subsp. tuberculatae TaxID=1110392 RepID=A0ABT3KSB0_9BURK|nr:cation:proton antiporter [Verminephrobacter aporrectodeae]MCW5256163.1 sodium:proton exchanger [Verminephrobacter aporrectodeae subsp. tuberculatae]MCW5321212.1 sodium:proton exchanger [Verminephrobacter aporrectodeae subsp. tuberculatae]MCW8166870.1 sodium:proton exchanger [Verminephrobacter aporrectodeae subsp. tuberculatae]MCW8171059.1 sodium:proton exchanger [Verminephrobacter aporrectodeae subsp. tuberculatae]MCW8208932.1 sodium:proton exchanger [Verminephrobacter aporrectodeae subsp. 
MNEILSFWAQWLRPSAGLPTVQWSLLLAVAAMVGYLVQRHTGLPKMVGYSLVGTVAGLAGFSGAVWPLQGISLFLLELAVAIVLFECGGRIPLRWFRHNPMVLVQSIAESVLTYFAVYWTLIWLDLPVQVAGPLALVALAASPTVLTRVVADTRAAGPVTERAIVLTTLSTLYALTLGSARAEVIDRKGLTLLESIYPVVVVLGVSIVVATVLALALRTALRLMSPASENTSMLFLALVAAGTAVAAHMGGSAPLAALLGGMLLKQLNPRPWAWPHQLGNASSLLTMLMFVLVSTVAAQAAWNAPVAGVVLALIAVRLLAKVTGVALGNVGSGASWKQALWVGCAMTPMSAIALLIASRFVQAAPATGQAIASVTLPAILLMEMLGAVIASVAIYQAGESAKPWAPRGPDGDGHGS